MNKQIEIQKSEGALVDLFNQEMKELQAHKKRIEEMARVICGFACDYENCDICPFNCINAPCEYHGYAINLINANYRKGETISFQAMIDAQNADRWQQGYEQGKRETTEKFSEMAKTVLIKAYDQYVENADRNEKANVRDMWCYWNGEANATQKSIDLVDEICEEIREE